jgi:putative resolvase
VCSDTLRGWADDRKVRSVRSFGGKRFYFTSDVRELMHGSCEAVVAAAVQKQKEKIIYTRVSSPAHHQRGDFITDSASGINFQRRGLKTILDRAHKGTLDELVVAYKDRLCRFTFDLVRDVLARSGCKLVVLGEANEPGGEA